MSATSLFIIFAPYPANYDIKKYTAGKAKLNNYKNALHLKIMALSRHVVDFLLKGSNYKPLPCVHRQGELPKLPIYKHIKCDTNINHL
ncbi:MAG: hypothetical protein IJ874_08070, partial [Ruminococcus sp.]|nr:hypothetical protein [Ruminococcus sp.]